MDDGSKQRSTREGVPLEFDRWGHLTNECWERLFSHYRRFGDAMHAVLDAGYNWSDVEPLTFGERLERERDDELKRRLGDHPPIVRDLGFILHVERRKKGLRLIDVAEALGIHKSAVSKIETGRRSLRIDELQRFADLLQVPVTRLVWAAAGLDEASRADGDE